MAINMAYVKFCPCVKQINSDVVLNVSAQEILLGFDKEGLFNN